jgi:glycerol-3-phosphate cytidylyltransferase
MLRSMVGTLSLPGSGASQTVRVRPWSLCHAWTIGKIRVRSNWGRWDMRVVTFGTFDLLHIGHIRILKRCAALGDVIVGVSSDELSYRKKGRLPIYRLSDRMEIVGSISGIKDVFVEYSLEEKAHYLRTMRADIFAMGDDWTGKFDWASDICKVMYFPRTEAISTTETLERIAASES